VTALRFIAAALLLLCLAGCVTETKGRQPVPQSDAEAAELNLQLGIGYLRQGDWEAARSKLEKAIDQDPKLVNAHIALGLVYERIEDPDAAERFYRRAVQLAPQDPDALNPLAAFLCRSTGRRTEALEYFDRALAIPQSTKASNKAVLNTNAGICAKPVDIVRAEAYLREALRFDPNYSEALLQLADVAYDQGNHLQARAFLERALAAQGPSPAALWLGVRIEAAMGAPDAAARYARQLKQDYPTSVETRLLLERERDAR
jgi:type IV pilus assembly protein PilF